MSKSVYTRKYELYKEWSEIYNSIHYNMPFDKYQKLYEKEDKAYKRWLFYDKLLKRLEVMKYGNKKKNCNKKTNSTYKRSKTTTGI